VVSNQSGADIPPGTYRDTALGASYYWDGVTERLLYVNESKANTALNNALSGAGFSAEMKLVTVNQTKYGGGGENWAVFAGGNSSASEVALHELGHSFGLLADEYDYGGSTTYTGPEPSEVNVTKNSNPLTCKWSNWIGYVDPANPVMGAIGLYEGAKYSKYGLYRPSSNSKMRALSQPFNAVCREQLILRIYQYVNPLDNWLSNATPLTDPPNVWVDVVDPDVISLKWYVNGDPVSGATGESFDLEAFGFGKGSYQVKAHAYDNTIVDWVRRSQQDLAQDVTWSVTITPEPATLAILAAGAVCLLRARRATSGCHGRVFATVLRLPVRLAGCHGRVLATVVFSSSQDLQCRETLPIYRGRFVHSLLP
jgi:hypothetical protein